MIRSLVLAIFLGTTVNSLGQIVTVLAKDGTPVRINIPAGKYMEIIGYNQGINRAEGAYLKIQDGNANVLNSRVSLDEPVSVAIKVIAGPNTLLMQAGRRQGTLSTSTLSYRLVDNIASSTSKPASPKAEDIKLTDEFLMLDYTVQANTTYKLGISKDLKTWKPLFEFTPESDKLNVELPKIILGNESYLKLE